MLILSYLDVSISVEEEMLKLKSVESVWKYSAQPVVTEVEPSQCHEVGERTDFERLEATLAEVEMFKLDE